MPKAAGTPPAGGAPAATHTIRSFDMLTVDQALGAVLARATCKPARRAPIREALGLVLAEDVASDVDSPPHDKAMVDGYALLAGDAANPPRELAVLEEVTAGEVPRRDVQSGAATRIMTGAPVPRGADSVVMIEQTAACGDDGSPRVRILEPVRPGQNIMRAGTSLRRGQVVLRAGCVIRPIEVGLLAEVGRADVLAVPAPRVAVLATGNELVPPGEAPAAGQIRNSNGPMLEALVARCGGRATDLGIARDEAGELSRLAARGLEADVLILSGGVSAGVLDLVPAVLRQLGVVEIFHKVHLKPGKPLWFGQRGGSGESPPCLVFGLPGNPVSSLVCFELFVRPALGRLAGRHDAALRTLRAELARTFSHRADRPTYHPAFVREEGSGATVDPLPWHGSADLNTLAAANCLAFFPAGQRQYAAGEEVVVHSL
jgi:molybdopterin molybdotransferase